MQPKEYLLSIDHKDRVAKSAIAWTHHLMKSEMDIAICMDRMTLHAPSFDISVCSEDAIKVYSSLRGTVQRLDIRMAMLSNISIKEK